MSFYKNPLGEGVSEAEGDARWVNKSGDTMTGDLEFQDVPGSNATVSTSPAVDLFMAGGDAEGSGETGGGFRFSAGEGALGDDGGGILPGPGGGLLAFSGYGGEGTVTQFARPGGNFNLSAEWGGYGYGAGGGRGGSFFLQAGGGGWDDLGEYGQAGGDLNFAAGDGGWAGGQGGNVLFEAGDGESGEPAGAGANPGQAGFIRFTSGRGGDGTATTPAKPGGDVEIFGGYAGADQGGGGAASGDVLVSGGQGWFSNSDGGSAQISGGLGGTAGAFGGGGDGGEASLLGGDGGAGSATFPGGAGGDVTIEPGQPGTDGGAGTGSGGRVAFPSSLAIATVGAPPAPGPEHRGKFWLEPKGAGQHDGFYICVKRSDDTYEWGLIHDEPASVLFPPPVADQNVGAHPVQEVSANGSGRLSFHSPEDFGTLVQALVLFFPSAGAAGAARDIDITVQHCGVGELYNTHEAIDTTSTYDLAGAADRLYGIDITALLSNLGPEETGGVLVDHNAIGGSLFYSGVALRYTRESN